MIEVKEIEQDVDTKEIEKVDEKQDQKNPGTADWGEDIPTKKTIGW
jgi:hypothetical protein